MIRPMALVEHQHRPYFHDTKSTTSTLQVAFISQIQGVNSHATSRHGLICLVAVQEESKVHSQISITHIFTLQQSMLQLIR